MTTVLAVLPLAIVMIAGPQIISAVMLATSADPRRNSVAFLVGVTLAAVTGVTTAFVLASLLLSGTDPSSRDETKDVLDYLVIALLLVMAVRVFLRRNQTEPPEWMKRLQEATPRFSFGLGFLLFLLMPTDIIAMVTVGTWLARHDLGWWQSIPFIAVTLLLAGIPLIILLVMGHRAETLLPRVRAWMTTNSWVVSEFVIFFLLTLNIL